MFKILDRYIIRKFLTTFFFMMGIIMLLAMVFDLSEKLGDFIDYQAPASAIIFDYYLNFILFYGNLFSPMIIFVSVIWFTAKMAQETEIIPILNSGRTFQRFLRPYMVVSTFLMLIALVLNHFVIPVSNEKRLEFEEKYYREAMYIQNYHAEFPGNQSVNFRSFASDDNVINDLVVQKWSKNKDSVVYFLKARNARYNGDSGKWTLVDYYERTIGYPNDEIVEGREKVMQLGFELSEIAKRNNIAEAMTFSELKKFIERERLKGSGEVPMYEIELYKRSSLPFATYVLTIIGVSVSSRKRRGGIGVNIALGLLIIFVYIFAMQVTTVAAIKVGFPAQIAVWIPNIIFGAVAYVMYRFALK
jgi:lipopolysaccharide export system permease protein